MLAPAPVVRGYRKSESERVKRYVREHMDNASFHRKEQLTWLAENHGVCLLFLPPYSPELNPIENFWAWLKRHLRSARSYASFDDALFDAFQVW